MDLAGLARTASYEFDPNALSQRAYAIFGDAFAWWKKLNPDGEPAILFAPSVECSRWFATEWCRRGVPVAHIDGEVTLLPRRDPFGEVYLEQYGTNDPGVRDDLLALSRSGEVRIVCNRFVLREAIDMPWLRHGIMATAFGGVSSYLQSVGRFQRYFPNQPFKIMQDHGGNYWRHGSPNVERAWSLEDTDRLIDAKRKEAIANSPNPEDIEGLCCPKCFTWRMRGVVCPSCGHSHKRSVRSVRMVDGELKLMRGLVHKPKKKKTQDASQIWTSVLFQCGRAKRPVASAVAMWQARCRAAGIHPDVSALRNAPPARSSSAYDLPVGDVFPWTLRVKK